jgi:hypothetical protein
MSLALYEQPGPSKPEMLAKSLKGFSEYGQKSGVVACGYLCGKPKQHGCAKSGVL